jgi:aspartate-semialdehyde dehydrogenase
MSVVVGRVRNDSVFTIKFVCLSHNTIRGAAGDAILQAELYRSRGLI